MRLLVGVGRCHMFANVWTRTGLWERADKEWQDKAGAVCGPIRWEAHFGYGEVTVAVEGGAKPTFFMSFCLKKEGGLLLAGTVNRRCPFERLFLQLNDL